MENYLGREEFEEINGAFDYLIDDFINDYNLYNSDDETDKLINDILNQNHVSILPVWLKELSCEELSLRLSKIILKRTKEEPKAERLKKFIPVISQLEQNQKIKKEEELKTNSSVKGIKLVKSAVVGTVIAVTLAATSNTDKSGKLIVNENAFGDLLSSGNLVKEISEEASEEYFLERRIDYLQTQKRKRLKARKENLLNDFSKCDSLNDIYSRQTELESLNLTKDDKVYEDCELSPELQQFIYEQAIVNKVPVDWIFSVIYTETRGKFNSSGEVSYNAPNNYDLGLTQQNTLSSLKMFRNEFNLDYDTAFALLRDNDYANVCSAFLEYDEIESRFDGYDPYEFAGCYNGWLNWREKSISREYVEIFTKAYDEIFTEHHSVEKVKK